MDNLFLIRSLTTAVNSLVPPPRRAWNRLFAAKQNMQGTDRLAFDIITGSEGLLPNLAVASPATVDAKTARTTVTVTAPRISNKRPMPDAQLNAWRAFGSQIGTEMARTWIAREQLDMRNKHDRTHEFQAVGALKGYIYDSDGTTLLVDYGLAATHRVTLTGDDLFSSPNSHPVERLRTWKRTIEDDSGTEITGWLAYLGYQVMDELLKNGDILTFMKYDKGSQMAESGRIQRLAEVELDEYNGSYLTDASVRTRFIEPYEIVLIGLCNDLVDCPYAPIIDNDAPDGVGNVTVSEAGRTVTNPFYSKSWREPDPAGTWIKVESRVLPVLQRPGAVIVARAV